MVFCYFFLIKNFTIADRNFGNFIATIFIIYTPYLKQTHPVMISTVAKQLIHNQFGKTIDKIMLIPTAIHINPTKCFVHFLIAPTSSILHIYSVFKFIWNWHKKYILAFILLVTSAMLKSFNHGQRTIRIGLLIFFFFRIWWNY